jgi:uncharacterized protein (TIGR02284 family)
MIKTDENSIRVLHQLDQVCRDALRGFQAAAADVPDPTLARLFGDYAAQREKLCHELDKRIRTLRAEPPQEGSVVGAVHRAWMDLESALASAELHAILTEVERGEDMAVTAYRAALEERDLDDETRGLIQRQYELVQAAHDRVQQLRDSATYAYR